MRWVFVTFSVVNGNTSKKEDLAVDSLFSSLGLQLPFSVSTFGFSSSSRLVF